MALRTWPLVPFVATRAEDVPAGITRFASVDGSVPGAAITWDHHVTGERVNLDAMPDRHDPSGLDAVGTTLADTDAVASAVAVILGGKAELPPAILRVLHSASHWCDHLAPDPSISEATENEAGRGLHEWVTRQLRGGAHRSPAFADVTRRLVDLVVQGAPLPFEAPDPTHVARARALLDHGRIKIVGQIALVDLSGEGPIDPLVVYGLHRAKVAVTFARHDHGCFFTVGVNPFVPHPDDLGPALVRIAKLEHAHGPPALLARPGPGSENWGGRATVFGSPWNYASRLTPDEVVRAVSEALDLG